MKPETRGAPAAVTPQAFRGERLGLPETGPGSIVPFGTRAFAFLVDAIASSLIAGLFVAARARPGTSHLPGSWSLIPLAIDYLVGVGLAGQTLGMYLVKLRLIRVSENTPVDLLRIAIRTALLFALIPALVWDRDGRGMHDKLTDTAVVRS